MIRALTILVVVWGLLQAAAVPSRACSCGPDYPPTPLEQYAAADAAFTGTVIGIAEDQTFPAFNNVTILVTGIWKGISTSIVHVLTSKTDGGCGVFFVVSDEYFIYAYNDRIFEGGPWSTDSCTRTTTVSSAQEDFDALGPPGPVPVSSVSWGIVKTVYDE
jgi:hypothetical protein